MLNFLNDEREEFSKYQKSKPLDSYLLNPHNQSYFGIKLLL